LREKNRRARFATTIIESGLDIPNTEHDRHRPGRPFRLGGSLQLRGRVGRAEHKAYAYLLLPREMMTIGAARKRITRSSNISSLGAGFRICHARSRDSRAGSILRTAQKRPYHRDRFRSLLQLLKQAVAQLKGRKFQPRSRSIFELILWATNEAEFVAARPDGAFR